MSGAEQLRLCGILAQVVEHLTFNQVVRGSNPRCLMPCIKRKTLILLGFPLFSCNLLYAFLDGTKCSILVPDGLLKAKCSIFVPDFCAYNAKDSAITSNRVSFGWSAAKAEKPEAEIVSHIPVKIFLLHRRYGCIHLTPCVHYPPVTERFFANILEIW